MQLRAYAGKRKISGSKFYVEMMAAPQSQISFGIPIEKFLSNPFNDHKTEAA
ncbi:hypothetical protein [Methylobacterium sp. Leaf465]|uniref:hypothetical protein n=1 Tax=Methylobacterium sp. Leaf465 TaxID=1736385 RepID=UPI001AEBB4B3|nr:hypothetical protein [Methylobacterium sp. Leaf465]